MISSSGPGVSVASEVIGVASVVVGAASVVVEVSDAAVVVVVASEVVDVASVVVGAAVASSSAIDVIEADGSSRTETVSVAPPPVQPAATITVASSVRNLLMVAAYYSSWSRSLFISHEVL